MNKEVDFNNTKIDEKFLPQELNMPLQQIQGRKLAALSPKFSLQTDFEDCLKNVSQEKKGDMLKLLKKLGKQDKIPVNIPHIQDIKTFFRTNKLSEEDKEFKIDFDNFDKKDIDFITTCLENRSVTLNPQNLQADFTVQSTDGQISYKTIDVSKSLISLIEYSFKTQKPVRVDFNGNSSVILKMHNNGKLVAEFISNDKAMEYMLKSSIPGLKDKLNTEGIPYEEISYKDNSKNKERKKGDNK